MARVELLLYKWSKEVSVVGIWGMSGIGKTTIAEVLFWTLLSEYRYRSCFCAMNLREELEKNTPACIKKKLYSKLLKENLEEIPMNIALPCYVTRRLRRKRALILLNDVYELEELKFLINEENDCFGPSSIIIVTSRDKQLLHNVAGDRIYEVEALDSEEALQLFRLTTSKKQILQREWIEPSEKEVRYADGNPLAIKVLSSLYGLTLRGKLQPKDVEKKTCEKIQKVFRLSYDRLYPDHQEFFLFLSCFFQNGPKESIRILLNDHNYSAFYGFKVLENKALIKISENDVWMHKLNRKMGQEIVRTKSFEPGKRSHLWCRNDICQVLKNNTGTKWIQSIVLDMMSTQKDLCLDQNVFEKMVNLKLLKFHGNNGVCTFLFPKGLASLPNQLRLLHWEGYPLKLLPSTFCTENLVELNMPHSRLVKLWDGDKELVNLKRIDVSNSKHLIQLPNLSKASKLESIDLSHCCSLVELHESILSLPLLKGLCLFNCEKLKGLKGRFIGNP